ncbi:hypothetical protein RUM44_001733 [Polyplax serrata]|uniref:G-protein coupled receptors family 1 profile domain-containing protein n=1 Tax=Polyplax serrata TaxID=468196 RepID=A0ABR1AKV4_POLSC
MAVRNLTARNLILTTNDTKNNTQTDVFFNFSLKVAYDIILKSRQSDVFFPEIEIVLIVIYVALMTSGVLSNVLVCFVVMRQCARKKVDLQKSRNLYIVNLAIADLALCCICTPFTLVTIIQKEWSFGSLLCKLIPVLQGTNISVSAGTITAIALDRFKTIVKSSSSNNLQNRKYSTIVITIILIWLLSFIFEFPLFFYTVTESVAFDDVLLYEKCIQRWPSRLVHSAFTVGLALIQFVIPVLVLTVIHLKISSYLRLHIKPLRKPKPEIQIHSPMDPVNADKISEVGSEKLGADDKDPSKKVLLCIRRRESVGSENSNKSCDSSQRLSDCSRKNSESSRKNSDSSRNSCDLSPRKRSDFFLSFRENSDFYSFSFSRFSYKSKSNKSQKRREIRRNRRTTFILSCIALVYAISWLPMTIFQIASTLLPEMNQNPKLVYILFAFCHILAMSSTITNPLLYGWLNTNFRREFTTIFARVSSCYTKVTGNEYDSTLNSRKKTKGHSHSAKHEIFA